MGYQRNDLVRAVVSGKSRMFGFLGFHSRFESAARMLEGVLNEADAQAYTIKVLPVGEDHISPATIEQCIRLRLAGVIALNPGGRELKKLHQQMARYRIPVVVGDDALPPECGIRVTSDDRQGVASAIEHLAQQGHRHIAFVSADPKSPIAIAREAGYRAAMKRLGLCVSEDDVAYCHWDNDRIAQQTRQLVKNRKTAPTAICCITDDTAMVVLRTVRGLGLRVPQDVSVVGYANLVMSELSDPPLTTVAQPFEAMGRSIIHHLLKCIEHGQERQNLESFEELLPTRLIVRQSTGPAPEKGDLPGS